MSYSWQTPVRYIRTIGPTRSRELTKIGIATVGELLEKQPLSYLYPGGVSVSIADAKEGMVVIKATINWIGRFPGRSVVGATLSDGTGMCKATWYNSPWLCASLHPGVTATFYGKMKGGVLQQPKWTTVESTMKNVYGGQYGVHHATIRAALKEVLAHLELPEMHNGLSRVEVLNSFHFPYDKYTQQQALADLKQDEALCLQLALAEKRRGQRSMIVEPMKWTGGFDAKIISYFPYEFTRDQNNAICKIIDGTCDETVPMQRLIHGEVGSGKTAVAFYAAMLAALNGKRTLILCPTTILAQQHFDTLKGMGWKDLVLYCAGEEKQSCDWYRGDIVIGTHAILNNKSLLKSTSLVIIDEFQKFGVEQRAKLQKNNPHLLLMSATPIPRSLAATVFGDLDVSVIKELPIKRGTVVTRWVLPDKREAMYEIIEKELAKGRQAYVVYPRISGDEDVVSAERGYTGLAKRFHYDWYVGLLTGKDSTEVKAKRLKMFRDGHTQILVSTIIAEVGLDNPNATVMVVEGADRFGLSQLHQLRGRVCRSTDTSFCFLVSDTANSVSIARLEVIEKTNDGFLIAEEDLRLRGAGEVFSTRQSGLPDLKWCSLVDDYDLMIEAKELVASGSVGSGVREMMDMKYNDSMWMGGTV